MSNERPSSKTVMTSIRIPEHLHRAVKEKDLCLTDIVIEAIETTLARDDLGCTDPHPSSDDRVDAALKTLDGDHDLLEYLISAKRIHRKVVAYTYSRIEWESGVILSRRQRERARTFLEQQFAKVRYEIETRPPPLDETTERRLGNYMTNAGYSHKLEITGKSPELLREIGERFILASGPVRPTSLESIVEYLSAL